MTWNILFLPADLRVHRPQIIDLNLEYMGWAFKEIEEYYKIDMAALIGMPLRDYVTNAIEGLCSYTPPRGIYYLLSLQDTIIGMGALRQVKENVGELKRMYIQPAYRGRGYGKALVNKLLERAREFAYHSIYLDSGPFMIAAHSLYRSFGFIGRKEYPETEVPQQLRSKWLFMEKTLEEVLR